MLRLGILGVGAAQSRTSGLEGAKRMRRQPPATPLGMSVTMVEGGTTGSPVGDLGTALVLAGTTSPPHTPLGGGVGGSPVTCLHEMCPPAGTRAPPLPLDSPQPTQHP